MKCARCGKVLNKLNHYYIPVPNSREGKRLCISCAKKEENVVTLI